MHIHTVYWTRADPTLGFQAKVKGLALRVIADRLENGEPLPQEIAGVFEAA